MAAYRKQHIVPAGYLRAFTAPNTKGKRLHALDLLEGELRATSPRKAAHFRDFYRIENAEDDDEALALERDFSKIEDAFFRVRDSLQGDPWVCRSSADVEAIIAYIALQKVRTQRLRSTLDDGFRQISRQMLALYAASYDRYEVYKMHAREAGVQDVPTREEMLAAVKAGDVDSPLSKSDMLFALMTSWKTCFPLMSCRPWSLVTGAKRHGGLIASDNPVAFLWTHGARPLLFPPGLGTPDTMLVFPISPDAALVSEIECPECAECQFTKRHVGQFNSAQLNNAERWLYSSCETFRWIDRDGIDRNARELLEMVRRNTPP